MDTQAQPNPSEPSMEQQEQLPIWPSNLRGLPNSFSRSALFTVGNVRTGVRLNLKRHQVAALGGIEITYTGEELFQDDEDVLLQILHLARMQPIATEVTFRASAMVAELGWSRNANSIQRLADCIDRMKASSLSVTVESPTARENFSGSLIRAFRWREEASNTTMREWTILLEREIVGLFNPQTYTRLDWSTRLKLPPLAKWLHSFYHSHAEPFPFKVETLHRLTGSKIKELYKFRYKLREALEQLVESGFFESAYIDPRTDLVMVKRNRQYGMTPALN